VKEGKADRQLINPLPLSKELFLDITSNTAWIASSLRDGSKKWQWSPG
jgi:hypothetical protein